VLLPTHGSSAQARTPGYTGPADCIDSGTGQRTCDNFAYPTGDYAVYLKGMTDPDAYAPFPNAILYNWSSIFVLIVPTIFCWFAWFRVVALAPVVVSTVGIMLVPVMAVIGGSLLLDEAVGSREIAALAFVILGIALVLMPQKKSAAN
jgi:hypothetical protein